MRLGVVGGLDPAELTAVAGTWPGEVIAGDRTAHLPPLDALLGWDDDADVPSAVAGNPTLRWVHTRWAGVDPRLLDLARVREFHYTNGSGGHGAAVAEHVLALVLALYKGLREMILASAERRWLMDHATSELRGRTVGILGWGDLGRSTAVLLRPFGVRVLGLRRRLAPDPLADEMLSVGDLPRLLARSHVIVVAVPLTAATQAMLGSAELALLPAGSLVVNVSRGAVIDEAALLASLRSGHLGGAALDVFPTEPLPPESPWWLLPNVIISPHCADRTPQTRSRCLQQFLENAHRFLAGRPLLHVVDAEAGY